MIEMIWECLIFQCFFDVNEEFIVKVLGIIFMFINLLLNKSPIKSLFIFQMVLGWLDLIKKNLLLIGCLLIKCSWWNAVVRSCPFLNTFPWMFLRRQNCSTPTNVLKNNRNIFYCSVCTFSHSKKFKCHEKRGCIIISTFWVMTLPVSI